MKQLLSIILLLLLSNPLYSQNDSAETGLADTLLLEGVDADFVIDRYITAIGGREKLSDVKDRTTKMTGTVTGFDVKMTIYQKQPNLLRQEIQASGLDQLIIFDGVNGIVRMGEEEQKLDGNELKRLRFEAFMGLILHPDSAGLKFELAGTRMIGDNRAYKINNIVGDEDLSWSSYYSFDTGLKLLEEKQITTPSGKFLQEVYFKEYKEVDGVKYPFKIEQKLGSQELNFTVTSIKINQELEDSLFRID